MEEKLFILYAKTKTLETRMQMYAMRARREKDRKSALLCTALSISLQAQAKRLLYQMRGFIATTDKNIDRLKTSELPELTTLHEEIENLAAKKSKALETGSNHAWKVNTLNTNLVTKSAGSGDIRDYHICGFCGFISNGTIPENCPICTAVSGRFIKAQS